MTSRNLCYRLHGFLFILLCLVAHAEITTDGSLGPAVDLLGPDFHIGAVAGQQHGVNLFHSFRDFHIRQGESATFTGPDSVANIIARVTGGEASEINGVLRSEIPAAEVYLINPAGLMFGPEAALDVPAGFHAGSADYVKLADGVEFHGDLLQASRFSSAAPAAFGFLAGAHGAVTVTGASNNVKPVELRVQTGQALRLAGGDIEIRHGTLSATQGRIALIAVQDAAEVGPDDSAPLTAGGTIRMHENATVDVSGEGGGSVLIRSGQLEIRNSVLLSETLGDSHGQDIRIRVDSLEVLDGGRISVSTYGKGNSGHLDINASGTVQLSAKNQTQLTGIFTRANQGSDGNAGHLTITADSLEVRAGAKISASTFGKGNGGRLEIHAGHRVLISGKDAGTLTGIFAGAHQGSGDAGNVTITTPHLEVIDNAIISASTKGAGKGGSVDIDSSKRVFLSASEIGVRSEAENGGTAGNIHITAPRVKLVDHAEITSHTEAADGGSIEIITSAYLYLDHSLIETQVKAKQGNGGNISIAPGFIILDNSYINANAYEGNGGRIDIQTHGVYPFERKPLTEVITATSEQDGIDGEIILASPEVDVGSSVTILPAIFADEPALQQSPCSAADSAKTSRFAVSRCRSGVPVRGRGDLLPPAALQ